MPVWGFKLPFELFHFEPEFKTYDMRPAGRDKSEHRPPHRE